MTKFLVLLSVMLCIEALAAGLAVKGNYRARGNNYRNLPFDQKTGARYRNYIDHRFRFNGVFVANDLIVIKSDIDFLGNCADYDGSSFGCLFGQEEPTSGNHPAKHSLLSHWGGNNVNTVYAKRMWAEINTKYGLLSVGRMPDAWGAGIFANSGDELWDNYGDSRDRLQFDMKIGSVDISPFFGNLSERDIESTNDLYEMGFKIKYNMVDTKNVYGLYIDLESSKGSDKLTTYDLYANHNFGIINFELEIAFQNGKMAGRSLDASGILGRLVKGYKDWITASLEVASASGDDSSDDYTEFSYNPDYKPTLIMFAQEHGSKPFRSNDDQYPASVHNALYLKPKLEFVSGNSTYDIAYIWGNRHYADDRSKKKALGHEIDFSYVYRNNENLFYGIDAAIFRAGEYFKGDAEQYKAKIATFLGAKVGIKF